MKETAKKVEILAIGAHPDDVEVGAGGYVALAVSQGYQVGIVDLTRGEMGSKGTPEKRREEALQAAGVLGVCFRVNLDLGDTRLCDVPALAEKLARVIRQAQPVLILAPHWVDRHPDHSAAAHLAKRALFYAALRKMDLGEAPCAGARVMHYPINEDIMPDLVVDISATFHRKRGAVAAFTSQFGVPTLPIDQGYFGKVDYLADLELRARSYGAAVGVTYAEGFVTGKPLLVNDPLALLTGQGSGPAAGERALGSRRVPPLSC